MQNWVFRLGMGWTFVNYIKIRFFIYVKAYIYISYKKIYLPVHPFCNDALSVQTWCIQTAHRDQGQFLAIDIQWKGQTLLLEWNCDFFPLLHWHLNWKMKAWNKKKLLINWLKYLITRLLAGSTDQPCSSRFYFTVSWESKERPSFLWHCSLLFLQGLRSTNIQ